MRYVFFKYFSIPLNTLNKITMSIGKPSKPTSLRLGDLKVPLQIKAMELDRSMNWYICKLIREHPEIIEQISKMKINKSKK